MWTCATLQSTSSIIIYSTPIVNDQYILLQETGLEQEYEIEQQFNNLILIISFVNIVDLSLI